MANEGQRTGFLTSIFRGIDFSRRLVVNLLFLLILAGLFALTYAGGPQIPEKAALVLRPHGRLVEQLSGMPLERALAGFTGNDDPETLVYDLIDAIVAAKDDERIQVVVLDLSDLTGAGLEKLERVGAALGEFKKAGKKVVATADVMDDTGYFLAAAADEIYLHDQGMVLLDGFERFARFYKQGLDMYEVDWNVFRVGEYKSAVEPYLRDDMSPEAKEANLGYMNDLWRSYVAQVAAARKMTPEVFEDGIARLRAHLATAGGDTAKAAKNLGLVDKVGGRDLLRNDLIALVGEDEEAKTFNQVDMETYLEALGDDRNRFPTEGEGVAVVVASGPIVDGSVAPGQIGGDSTAALIRQARRDDSVKAIVLRVDSGGGSAFASEVIRRELVLAREAGKKVVVSMGHLAASGGYWIATASDEVWASPNTITGSIGIFGMFPTIQKPLAKYLGAHVDGVGTTWLAGALRPDRELNPEVGDLIQTIINRGYQDFLERVGEARKMSVEQVDKIARGRVWSGEDAKSIGLVDQLGDLDAAIAAAAKLAGLPEGHAVTFIEKEQSFKDQLMSDLFSSAVGVFGPLENPKPGLREQLIDAVAEDFDFLAQFNDPRGVYAKCFCEIR